MEFWDEIYKKMTTAADYTAKETTKLTEMAKLKYNLMREKSKLEEAYKKLGELYYAQMKDNNLDEHKLSMAFDKIEKIKLEIERLEDAINLANNVKLCVECKAKIEKDMKIAVIGAGYADGLKRCIAKGGGFVLIYILCLINGIPIHKNPKTISKEIFSFRQIQLKQALVMHLFHFRKHRAILF